MAMIAVPADSAQDVCNRVMDAGIHAVLNFAPVRLAAPQGTKIKSIDLSISLESLSYFLSVTGVPAVGKEKVLNGELASSPTMDESKAYS
jgi:redox-sensing transcriptional repressor